MIWDKATPEEIEQLKPYMSRVLRSRGISPHFVCVARGKYHDVQVSAMFYKEEGKWDRIGIQLHPGIEIRCSWSKMHKYLKALSSSNETLIEIYPPLEEVVNTANVRWFWIVPKDFDCHVFNI